MRFLTDETGIVTDRWKYSPFGGIAERSGTDANPYLFAGERYDPATDLYHLRARWLDPKAGRFVSKDPWPGSSRVPQSLNSYVYAGNSPANRRDPLGLFDIGSIDALTVALFISNIATVGFNAGVTFAAGASAFQGGFDGAVSSLRVNYMHAGWTLGGGVDVLYFAGQAYASITMEGGLFPLSIFQPRRGIGYSVLAGPVFNLSSPQELSGMGHVAAWPLNLIRLLPRSLFGRVAAWDFLMSLARLTAGGGGWVGQFGFSTSGPSFVQVGPRSNDHSNLIAYSGDFVPIANVSATVQRPLELLGELTSSIMQEFNGSSEALLSNPSQFLRLITHYGSRVNIP